MDIVFIFYSHVKKNIFIDLKAKFNEKNKRKCGKIVQSSITGYLGFDSN